MARRTSASIRAADSPFTAWRVLNDGGARDPRSNLALDEALARATAAPTLRLWRNDPCVVLGRFQIAAAEVDVAVAEELHIPVLRRFSGGGAVYHDPANLNVTLVGRRGRPPFGDPAVIDLPALYRKVLEPLALALGGLGLDVERTEREILLNGRKVTGVAAWLGREVALVHATLLVDADLEALQRVLAGPGAPGNGRWERTRSRRMPVTSLRRELGTTPALDDRALEHSIVAAFGAMASAGGMPSAEELSFAAQLLASRYGLPSWHAEGLDRA
jgi:lipoate-protein ligase A